MIKERVAYLGPEASYTHQATSNLFNEDESLHVPQLTIEDVVSAVQSATVDKGVVPFENSINGAVIFTLDLFAEANRRFPDIFVHGETYVPVRHCLLAHNPTDNAISAENINKLYSHPQAWGQCKKYLSKHLKGIERIDVSSTSKAAQIVAKDVSGQSAAISSVTAARLYGLTCIAEGIEDSDDNSTRFFILSRKTSANEADRQYILSNALSESSKSFKMLFVFKVDHENPGALADSLAVFKTYNLNLTSINSRPSGDVPWHYVFFVEIEGQQLVGRMDHIKAAFKDIEAVTKSWRCLGAWKNELA